MRLLPNTRYGTERYPEKVARRLRTVNFAAWCVAVLIAAFGLLRIADPPPGGRWIGPFNLAVGVVLAALPLLHRFGPLIVPVLFLLLADAFIFWVNSLVGTGGGVHFFYLTAAASGVPFLGVERARLAAVLAVLAAALMVGAHIGTPYSTGFLTYQQLFYTNLVINVVASVGITFAIVFYAARGEARAEAAAESEHRRSEELLANILPPRIAERLKGPVGAEIADAYKEASILFLDMAGFTARASDTTPGELVRFLNRVFTRLDALVERHGLEKIKTTGDAYMVVSGVPEPRPDHAEALAALALEMRDALSGLVDLKGRAVPVRIGIASGPVVAGVVGTSKFFYDLWGDAVNVAARMEQTGEPGRIQVTSETGERLKGRFTLEPRGTIEVHGKGRMETWWLSGRDGQPAD